MKNAIIIFGMLIFVGCQTPHKDIPVDFSQGRWTGRLLVRDLKNSKSQVVHYEAQGIRDQALRFEVTASMGIPLAILVIRPEQTEYLLPREKKFISGPSVAKVLSPVFTTPVDPLLLFTILFDSPPSKDWQCERDQVGQLLVCKSSNPSVTVRWKSREGLKRAIEIAHKDAVIQMNVNTFEVLSSVDKSLFSISKPQGFKSYRLK